MAFTPPTSQAPAWVSLTSEEAEDVDEPPEFNRKFERTAVRPAQDQSSLLTKAIMAEPEETPSHHAPSILLSSQRRRSMTSNVSIASTADLTSDTGMTSPCRTNTPSPPIPEMAALRLHHDVVLSENKHVPTTAATQPPKKRCIQFACAAKPPVLQAEPMVKAPSAEQAPRRPSIKFACPERPASTQNTPPRQIPDPGAHPSLPTNPESPSTPKKTSALSAALHTSPRSSGIRRLSNKPPLSRPKFLRANSKDLVKDSSQFHEFASGTAREEDWIRQPSATVNKLTIHDTLTKENHFRRLGAEAEEEAELEEEEDEAISEEEEEDDEDDNEDASEEDGEEDFEEDSDGYHTDSETGFADSDEEDEEDENMILWTPSHATARQNKIIPPVRRPSLNEPQSDSSIASRASRSSIRRAKARRIKVESDAPDLPDSTDFVCGTLDEDRPLEEAYLSCLAARRNEKLRVIPQDIDPSFPASDPDDDDEEELYNPVHHDSDEDVWVQGHMEDLHHGQERSRRRRKSEQASPRKYRSPPPRRHHSPAPKVRGRSPKPLFGRHSPKRMRSPAPKAMNTPLQTPRQGAHVQFHLAGRPGMTQTKSLPRQPALFAVMKSCKPVKHQHQHDADCHLRGAIDIVKGLERKRQRRKEKFFQKYCNRARRGQIPERKPQPGRGAERMKELGLLMAGKKEQGNYVMSI
ncbi:GTP-binding protein SAR1 [Pochonia chlamydosporia 170]|uniref:GTP-binding protein SAR1 n=1 Tax=Pochonia chlamydosporia 170 TaxID=1380566 RepID=A0A179FXL2_METCM|nr:GTP-binding protein SAR1 [Pochonia chlamydosporia 170]OAQ70117.1 GTP-binding protein SAR1 [Pochonia chlamydosporia 170]